MVKTQDLWEYREFDRSLMPKTGNNHSHLEQVRCFILKNGFQEPIIISCELTTGKAYITEGNHHTMSCYSSLAAPQWLLQKA